MSPSTIRLVARRDVEERLRSRTFWTVNAVIVLLLVAAVVLPVLLDDPTEVRVATVGSDAAMVAGVAATMAEDGQELSLTVSTADTDADARQLLRDDEADLALIGTDEVAAVGTPTGPGLQLLLSARRVVLLDDLLATSEVPADVRAQALTPTAPTLTDVDGGGADPALVGIGFIAVYMLYGLLFFYGHQVAQSIVQEKQSRVIEILLSSISPRELLVGKVLGLGVLGLAQIAVLLGVGVGSLTMLGEQPIPVEAIPTLLAVVAFYVVGYALYASLFALAGAVVSSQEDLQSSSMLPMVLLIGSLLLAQAAIGDPTGALVTASALAPPSAPVTLPLLIASGTAEPWLVVAGSVVTVAAIALIVPLAARAHAGAALMTRSRVDLRTAVRASG